MATHLPLAILTDCRSQMIFSVFCNTGTDSAKQLNLLIIYDSLSVQQSAESEASQCFQSMHVS